MNWDAVGATAELLGAVAVFITLAYLTIQVKQNSKTQELNNRFSAAKTSQARADTAIKFIQIIASNPELKYAYGLITSGLTLMECQRLDMEVRKDVRYVLSLARIMLENNFDQYRKGFLEHQYYAGTIEPQVDFPGFARHQIALKCNSMRGVYERQTLYRGIQERSC